MVDDHGLELELEMEVLGELTREEFGLDLRLDDFLPKDITSLVNGKISGFSLQSHTSLSRLGQTLGCKNNAGLSGEGLGGYGIVLSGLFQNADAARGEIYGISSRVVIAGPCAVRKANKVSVSGVGGGPGGGGE